MQLFVFVFPTAALCLFQTMELFNKSLLRHICMLFPRFSPFSSRRQGEWEWRRNFLWHWKDIKLSYMNWLNQFSYTMQPIHANTLPGYILNTLIILLMSTLFWNFHFVQESVSPYFSFSLLVASDRKRHDMDKVGDIVFCSTIGDPNIEFLTNWKQ